MSYKSEVKRGESKIQIINEAKRTRFDFDVVYQSSVSPIVQIYLFHFGTHGLSMHPTSYSCIIPDYLTFARGAALADSAAVSQAVTASLFATSPPDE